MDDQDFAAAFAARHGLQALRAEDPARFALQLAQQFRLGAAMPRLEEKEAAPAPVFRVVPA